MTSPAEIPEDDQAEPTDAAVTNPDPADLPEPVVEP